MKEICLVLGCFMIAISILMIISNSEPLKTITIIFLSFAFFKLHNIIYTYMKDKGINI
jgi:hypothetical protein